MKALVAGWFSYVNGHATGGDLMARDLLCTWLQDWDIEHVVAVAPPFTDGLPFDAISPDEISHAFFICGPFGDGELEADFLARYGDCQLIGLNLSMSRPVIDWNPFDLLIERDSSTATHSEMIFDRRQALPPVAGVCLVEAHPEARVDLANDAIKRLLSRHPTARLPIDTRLDSNETGLRTPGEIEAMIARVDWLVTTRLHGLVLALKNGVPAIAIDAVPGGGKITRQCRHIGWACLLGLDELTDARLDQAVSYVSSEAARSDAVACTSRAVIEVEQMRKEVEEAIRSGLLKTRNKERLARSSPPSPVTGEIAKLQGSVLRRLSERLKS